MAPSASTALDHFKQYILHGAGITEDTFALAAVHLREARFNKGEVLLNMGDSCKETVHVGSGLLRVASIDRVGKEHIVQFAPEGWFAGDRGSMYFNEPARFRIDAIEDSAVVFIDRRFFEVLAQHSPAFSHFNEVLLHNHIRHMQERIVLLLGASAAERYQAFVHLYPDLMLRVPQWMIASYLGITPESLSRVRHELAKRNFNPPRKG